MLAFLVSLPRDVYGRQDEDRLKHTYVKLHLMPLAGIYSAGAQIRPQRQWLAPEATPLLGGGVLLEFDSKWALRLNLTTSAFEANWKWDGEDGAGPNDNRARVRRVALAPSAIRSWRVSPIAVHVGAGLSVERQTEENAYREILERIDTKPILASTISHMKAQSLRSVPFISGGLDIGLGRRVSARADYVFGVANLERPPAMAIEIGLSYVIAERRAQRP